MSTIKFTAHSANRSPDSEVVAVVGKLEAGDPATSYGLTIAAGLPVEAQLSDWCRERGLPVREVAEVVTEAVRVFMTVPATAEEPGADPTV